MTAQDQDQDQDHTPDPRPLAVTLGDAAGIGPEVVLKALQTPLPHGERVVLYGALAPLLEEDARQTLALGPQGRYRPLASRLVRVAQVEQALVLPADQIGVVEVCPELDMTHVKPGQPDARCARAQRAALLRAVQDALANRVRAVCTAPWTKHLFSLIDEPCVGHTEVLGQACGVEDHVMMLAGPTLRVALVTTHVPLSRVSQGLTGPRLDAVIQTTLRGLRQRFGLERVRLAVCGLNPHAGEGGVMGHEERDVIGPAIERARERWPQDQLSGPWPSDTLFARFGRRDEAPFDAVLCMYHDQGLIPLKLLHFGQSANLTLGLPIIRTSVDHGTAYDIAGQAKADEGSMRYAMELALTLR